MTDPISIPITFEQLLAAIAQLHPDQRERVAQTLVQQELRADLADLIADLYARPPADDITDAVIMAEIKDLPVLATAIDGQARAIVSGDNDLRADPDLRAAMAEGGIQLFGVNSFLERLADNSEF